MKKEKTTVAELPDILSKRKAAEYFDCSMKTLERKMRAGLDAIKVDGKIYILRQSIVDYIAKKGKVAS